MGGDLNKPLKSVFTSVSLGILLFIHTYSQSLDASAAQAHVWSVEDQESLRDALSGAGMAAFVVNGANLARRSGDSDMPMMLINNNNSVSGGGDRNEEVGARLFASPTNLEGSFDLPHRGRVTVRPAY